MSDCRDAALTCPLHGHSSLMTPRGINLSKYVDTGTANMAAMRGGLLRRRQRTRGWTNKHTCSRMFANNCARFKDAETESCSSGHRKAATDSSSNQGGSKLHLKTKQQWTTKRVSSRVLPILLLWEAVAEVLSRKSGIHINNLKHKRAALKTNVMASTPAAQGQRSKNFHVCVSQMTETTLTSLTLMTVSSIWTSLEPGPEDKMLGQRRKNSSNILMLGFGTSKEEAALVVQVTTLNVYLQGNGTWGWTHGSPNGISRGCTK